MNEIIKIQERDGKRAVSARELYEKLGFNKTNWAKWYKKNITENPFAIENEDWTGFILSMNGNDTQDFALTIDFAKKISMMARTEQGEKIRRYFIEIEKSAMAITKQLEPEEMLLQSVQLMIEQKKRITAIESKVNEIDARTITRPDYFTIIGYATKNKIKIGLTLAAKLGRKAWSICKAKNYFMDEVPDPRFGRVRTYPTVVLNEVFSIEFNW